MFFFNILFCCPLLHFLPSGLSSIHCARSVEAATNFWLKFHTNQTRLLAYLYIYSYSYSAIIKKNKHVAPNERSSILFSKKHHFFVFHQQFLISNKSDPTGQFFVSFVVHWNWELHSIAINIINLMSNVCSEWIVCVWRRPSPNINNVMGSLNVVAINTFDFKFVYIQRDRTNEKINKASV